MMGIYREDKASTYISNTKLRRLAKKAAQYSCMA